MTSKPIDIYYLPPSPPSRAVLMVLKGLKLEHNIKITNIMEGDNMKPEFLKMNPFHTIPVINDNGWTLYESTVIMKYLVDQYADDDKLFPKDAKKGALVNLRCHFSTGQLYPKFVTHHLPTFKGQTPPDDALDNLQKTLKILDSFLDGQMYVAGQDLTIADISIITLIATIDACGSVDLTKYQNVWLWYQRTRHGLMNFGYEEVNHAGAQAFGKMYRTELDKTKQ